MSTRATILLVEDDPDLREALAEQLREVEFGVLEAGNGSEALVLAGTRGAELVLLDLNLPDIDGRAACRQLREQGFPGPIIMLTAAGGERETVESFDAGANDYVVKPFSFAVLLARVRAQLRTYEQSEAAVLHLAELKFRPAQRILVTPEHRKIRLTEKETQILRYLYRAAGRVVGRDELLGAVWGYNAGVDTHTLETHVYRLRQKIEKDPGQPHLLVSGEGGYRLASDPSG
jgi:DNA-binding response OmpR family regulator